MAQSNIPAAGGDPLIAKSIADIASDINGFSLAAVPAGMMNGWAASLNATICNEAGFTAPNKALVFNEAGFSVANKALVFNEAGFSVANKAGVCNHTNLTAAVLNAICDNANISSATIKAILDIETVTVASQLGAMLEGTQLSLANAATVCNSKYTDAQKAAAFNNAIMSAARSASIFNEAGFTAPNKALVFREAGLSIANINAFIIHANITDDNAQQILSEITKANRDLTSAANVYEMLDDWDDNKITGRDGAGTVSTGFTNLFAHKDKFRPEWTQVTGATVVTGGQLVMDTAAEEVSIPSTFAVGTWEIDGKCNNIINSNGVYFYFMQTANSNSLMFFYSDDVFRLTCHISEYEIAFSFSAATTYTFKVTRDGSGNFECFIDDVSKITQLNNNYTTSATIALNNHGNYQHELDNLKVY